MIVNINFTTKEEINDCPFCGSDEVALVFKGTDDIITYMQVNCWGCLSKGPMSIGEDYNEEIHGDSFESYIAKEAIIAWNYIKRS